VDKEVIGIQVSSLL